MRLRAVADDRPVPLATAPAAGRRPRSSARRATVASHARRAGRAGPATSAGSTVPPTSGRDGPREEEPGGDLGVERLGGRDAHLHVAPVGRVEDAVGLVGEVAGAGSRWRRPSRPAARTRSTVRLVSVVVPDWLMATTRVSLMSGRRPKPESSVAGRASTRSAAVGRRRPAAPRPGSGRRRGRCPGRSPAPGRCARCAGPRRTSARAAPRRRAPPRARRPASTSLPRSVLRNDRRLGDLLQQEVRELAPVDVAGGDLARAAGRRR